MVGGVYVCHEYHSDFDCGVVGVGVGVGVGVLLGVVLCAINEIGVLLNALLIPKEKEMFVREEEKGRGKGKWGII